MDRASKTRPRSRRSPLQPDGKIVAVGRVPYWGHLDFGAVRLLTEYVFADGFESGDASAWSSQSF